MLKLLLEIVFVAVAVVGVGMFSIALALIVAGVVGVVALEVRT